MYRELMRNKILQLAHVSRFDIFWKFSDFYVQYITFITTSLETKKENKQIRPDRIRTRVVWLV